MMGIRKIIASSLSVSRHSPDSVLRRVLTAFAFALIGIAASTAAAFAACTVPNTIVNGQVTDANQVMANFNSLAACISVIATGQAPPLGRLTLTSNTPVMTTDATAQATIYYTPYQGNLIPVAGSTYAFSELSYSLAASAHLSGHLYDIFAYNAPGSVALCTGPAWPSGTARAAGINMSNGVWSNQSSLTCTLSGGASTTTIPANNATYLGTFYATANGQTGMAFRPTGTTGGTNNILGLWNAYNRVTYSAMNRDTTVTWTYGSRIWTSLNGSASNRVSFVDGLGVSPVYGVLQNTNYATNGATAGVAINLDSTSATPNASVRGSNAGVGGMVIATAYSEGFQPAGIGLHYIQAMQVDILNAGTATYIGAPDESLVVSLPM